MQRTITFTRDNKEKVRLVVTYDIVVMTGVRTIRDVALPGDHMSVKEHFSAEEMARIVKVISRPRRDY